MKIARRRLGNASGVVTKETRRRASRREEDEALDKSSVAELSAVVINEMTCDELVRVILASGLPRQSRFEFLGRLPLYDRETLKRIAYLARQCCQNQRSGSVGGKKYPHFARFDRKQSDVEKRSLLNQADMSIEERQATALRSAVADVRALERDSITDAALRHLQASAHFGVRTLSCERHEGVLVLRGQVSSWYQKQLAQESVRCLSGVEEIINDVEVCSPSQSVDAPSNFTDGSGRESDRRAGGPAKRGEETC